MDYLSRGRRILLVARLRDLGRLAQAENGASVRLKTSVLVEQPAAGGNVIWSGAYLPFGREWNPQATTNHYKFTGYDRDTEFGLAHAPARYDSVTLGRFLTPDPDNASSVDDDPQTWNAYSYVRNSPIGNTDPDGTDFHVCVDTGASTHQCVDIPSDSDFYRLIRQSPAVSIQNGEIFANVGGQEVAAGTYQHFVGSGEEGIESDNLANFAIGGLFGAAVGGVADFLEGVFGSGGRTAIAPSASAAADASEARPQPIGSQVRPSPPPNLDNLSPKIENDMAARGWTQRDILSVYENGVPSEVVDRTAGFTPATQYLDPATGRFIVVNNATGKVIQVSKLGFRPNPAVK